MTASLRFLPLEKLAIVRMASGRDTLLLTENISWEEFPGYAQEFATTLHAKVTVRAARVAQVESIG